MNYSSHTESSLEGGPTAKRRRHSSADLKAHAPLAAVGTVASSSSATQLDAITVPQPPSPTANSATAEVQLGEATPVSVVPKIRVKPQLQRPLSPPEPLAPLPQANPLADPSQLHNFDMQLLKSRDNLVRYYDFMRRFYAGGSMLNQPVLAPPLYGSSLMQSLSFPTTTTTSTAAITTATTTGTTTTTKTTTDNNNPPESKQLSPPKATSSSPSLSASQQLKRSPDSGKTRARSPIASSATPSGSQPQPHTPINLTKLPFSSSRNGQPASTSTPVAVAPLKLELPSPPKPLTDLRIPQLLLRGSAAAEQSGMPPLPALPPLDLEQLKPITSTYLQLTRSMGLSDEDALRFDNLVSKDFKYTL